MTETTQKIIIIICAFAATCLSDAAASDRIIRMVSMEDFPPYTGKDLPEEGFASEIVREAFRRSGYGVEFSYCSFKRAVTEVEKGKYSAITTVYYTAERAEYLEHSQPYWTAQTVFFTTRDRPVAYKKLTELTQYKIGVLRGTSVERELRENGFRVEPVTDVALNLRKLLADRIDLLCAARLYTLHMMRQTLSESEQSVITVINPPFREFSVHAGFSKNRPEFRQLVKDFNRGLQEIRTDKTYDRILEKHGIRAAE